MISTGNDLIALKAINITRTKQQNFYKKIISDSEKSLYDHHFSGRLPLEVFVWLLWSVKESVYKYLQRITPGLIFSPTKIIISRLEPPAIETVAKLEGCNFDEKSVYTGDVTFGDDTLFLRSIISRDFIFSVVNHTDDFKKTCWGIRLISSADPGYQSKAARAFLTEMLSTLYPGSNLQISKSKDGIPVVLKNGAEISLPVSLTHHGHYVAYSFNRTD